MARLINKLNAVIIKKLEKAGLYSDGGGLWINVTNTCAKSWVFRFDIGKKRYHMGLGSIITVSLPEARATALNYRKLLLEKINPLTQRQQTVIQTK
jgi:hypothetical protein